MQSHNMYKKKQLKIKLIDNTWSIQYNYKITSTHNKVERDTIQN